MACRPRIVYAVIESWHEVRTNIFFRVAIGPCAGDRLIMGCLVYMWPADSAVYEVLVSRETFLAIATKMGWFSGHFKPRCGPAKRREKEKEFLTSARVLLFECAQGGYCRAPSNLLDVTLT